jgi:hypothetical protein
MVLSYSAFGAAGRLAELLAYKPSSTELSIASPGSIKYADAPIPTTTTDRRVLENLE